MLSTAVASGIVGPDLTNDSNTNTWEEEERTAERNHFREAAS